MGTGVKATVSLVQGRNSTLIWPSESKQLIPRAEQVGYATDVDDVQVAAGDVIRFEVHGNGDGVNDAVSWTPSIGYVWTGANAADTSRNSFIPWTIAAGPRSSGTR